MKRLFATPWYPIALSAYSVVAIFAHNIAEVRANMLWRPLVAAVISTVVMLVVLERWLKGWERGAMATAVLATLFFSYGHVLAFLTTQHVESAALLLLPTWVCLAAIGLVWASRTSSHLERATLPLNAAGTALLLIPLAGIAVFSVRMALADSSHRSNATSDSIQLPAHAALPDIYYIILDSYGRADVLESAYGYDNHAFIEGLEELGFYVASCSQSNYTRTELSLGSSLNMEYLQSLDPEHFIPENLDRTALWELLQHGSVRQTLEAAGYRTVAFATGFPWSEWPDADEFWEPSPLWNQLTEFEVLWARTTGAEVLESIGMIDFDEASASRFRERTRFALDSFGALAHLPGPKLVVIHVIAPHPPFVFDADGHSIDPGQFLNELGSYTRSSYAEGYQGQLTFINREILRAASLVIHESSSPPVIVIQGDHGPWLLPPEMHFKILNAYYLPGHIDALYPSISPVNTFRVILDRYLGGRFGLLEDTSYNSPVPNIYRFSPIPYSCGAETQEDSD
jgi:hypothetical protein